MNKEDNYLIERYKDKSNKELVESYKDFGKYLREYGKYNSGSNIISIKICMAEIDKVLKLREDKIE